jgi:hypothetical protein
MSVNSPEPINTSKVEPKVAWATLGSYLAGVVLLALVNALDESTTLLSDAIPDMFEPFLMPLVPALIALVSGYMAKHQWRVNARGQGSPPVG